MTKTTRSAWNGEDLRNDASWIFHWSPQALQEIDAALGALKAAGARPGEVSASDFPIPSAAADLARVRQELEDGTGFVLYRGLPVDRYQDDETALIFSGVGAHLGTPVSQNARGEKMVCVTAEPGAKRGQPNVRLYTTDSRLHFHTDNTDIIGLFCLRVARSGGESSVVSALRVHEEIRNSRPDLLAVLERGFIYDLMGEERPGVAGFTDRCPVFHHHAGRLSCRYSRNTVNLAPRKSGVPLTAQEVEALDYFESVAERPDLRFDMYLEPGDMQLLNNHVVLHARTEYQDFEEPERRRALWRLWLTAQDPRPLGPAFENRFGSDWSFRRGIPVRA